VRHVIQKEGRGPGGSAGEDDRASDDAAGITAFELFQGCGEEPESRDPAPTLNRS